MEALLWFLVTGGGTLWGYIQARKFVRGRLRYTDVIERPSTPVVAGTVAALATGPIAALLPVVTVVSALVFGVGIGVGVRHGARDVKRLPGY